MAFRHLFYSVPFSADGKVLTRVKQPVAVDNFGTQTFSVVDVDDETLNCSVPAPSDYTLEKLLNAGVPLQSVSVTLDSVDSQAEKFINENLNTENHED